MTPMKRHFLDIGDKSFVVSLYGNGLLSQHQNFRVVTESCTIGCNREPIVRGFEGMADSNGIKELVELTLQAEFPDSRARWKMFRLDFDDNGDITQCSGRITATVNSLLDRCGYGLAEQSLEDGREPEIAAMCGGKENALKVLAYLHRRQNSPDAE